MWLNQWNYHHLIIYCQIHCIAMIQWLYNILLKITNCISVVWGNLWTYGDSYGYLGGIGVDYSYIFNCHSVLGLCAKGQVKVSHILSLLIQVSKQAAAMVTGWHVECSPHNWHVIQSYSCIAILLQSSALEMHVFALWRADRQVQW